MPKKVTQPACGLTNLLFKTILLLMITHQSLSIQGITLDANINLIERSCYQDVKDSPSQNILSFEFKPDESKEN